MIDLARKGYEELIRDMQGGFKYVTVLFIIKCMWLFLILKMLIFYFFKLIIIKLCHFFRKKWRGKTTVTGCSTGVYDPSWLSFFNDVFWSIINHKASFSFYTNCEASGFDIFYYSIIYSIQWYILMFYFLSNGIINYNNTNNTNSICLVEKTVTANFFW